MYQDVTTAFLAVQAEQQMIAQRAERAWIKTEAELQGRFTPRPGAKARVIAKLNALGQVLGRRSEATATAQLLGRRRSAGAC